MQADSVRHHEVVIDGATIHLAEVGEAGTRTVLCLHGWPESWCAFEGVMAQLHDDAHR